MVDPEKHKLSLVRFSCALEVACEPVNGAYEKLWAAKSDKTTS